ncbi:MAG: hypothetical protein GX664_06385 [Bacteroidales bacterium]|nr:hypothetical protein [Bacteroidales bacterium]
MEFSEISIFQVEPDKIEEFESVMKSAEQMLRTEASCLEFHLVRRTHYIKDMETIRQGLVPDEVTRIVKCVKYALYMSYRSEVEYGVAQKKLYDTYWKAIDKCLIVPHDKILGQLL